LNHRTGELIRARCRATNLCWACAVQYALETTEMWMLSAVELPPTILMVLTSRAFMTRPETYRHVELVLRVCRKRWPGIEWGIEVEFQRRGALHLNFLVFGVPLDELSVLREVVVERWCSRVDARPAGQYVEAISSSSESVIQYLAMHFLKPEQAPPIGWKGHRTSCTRGFLVRPASVMRKEAKRSRAVKALIAKGYDADEAEAVVQGQSSSDWELRRVQPSLVELPEIGECGSLVVAVDTRPLWEGVPLREAVERLVERIEKVLPGGERYGRVKFGGEPSEGLAAGVVAHSSAGAAPQPLEELVFE